MWIRLERWAANTGVDRGGGWEKCDGDGKGEGKQIEIQFMAVPPGSWTKVKRRGDEWLGLVVVQVRDGIWGGGGHWGQSSGKSSGVVWLA